MTVDGLGELQQKRDRAKISHRSRNVPPPLNPRKQRKSEAFVAPASDSGVEASKPDGVTEILSTHQLDNADATEPAEDPAIAAPFTAEQYEPDRSPRAAYDQATEGEGWGETSRQVTVYVLPETKRLAAKTAKRQKKTNATVALDALDAMREQLHVLVEQRQSRRRPTGSMFSTRRALGGRQASSHGVPRDPFIMRVLESDFEILEELSSEHGANGISELVSVALEAVYSRTRTR